MSCQKGSAALSNEYERNSLHGRFFWGAEQAQSPMSQQAIIYLTAYLKKYALLPNGVASKHKKHSWIVQQFRVDGIWSRKSECDPFVSWKIGCTDLSKSE